MDKCRKFFEEWYEADAMPAESGWFIRDEADPEFYKLDHTQAAWEGWEACWYLLTPDELL